MPMPMAADVPPDEHQPRIDINTVEGTEKEGDLYMVFVDAPISSMDA